VGLVRQFKQNSNKIRTKLVDNLTVRKHEIRTSDVSNKYRVELLSFRKFGFWSIFGKVTFKNLEFGNLEFGKKHSTVLLKQDDRIG
jgi:hypothetical protein